MVLFSTADTPRKHRRISATEREYIEYALSDKGLKEEVGNKKAKFQQDKWVSTSREQASFYNVFLQVSAISIQWPISPRRALEEDSYFKNRLVDKPGRVWLVSGYKGSEDDITLHGWRAQAEHCWGVKNS